MLKSEIFYKEIKSKAIKGRYFDCPLLMFDPLMTVPWDFQHSSIYNMYKLLKVYPREIKQRYQVLYGAYLFEYDYHENQETKVFFDDVK